MSESTILPGFEKLLVEDLGFTEGTHVLIDKMLCEALEVEFITFEMIQGLFDELLQSENIQPEIASKGIRSVVIFLSQFPFDFKKDELLAAAARVKESQS